MFLKSKKKDQRTWSLGIANNPELFILICQNQHLSRINTVYHSIHCSPRSDHSVTTMTSADFLWEALRHDSSCP